MQSIIIKLFLKQDEQDKRQNPRNIEIILQTFSLLFWYLNLEKCSFNHMLCWFSWYIKLAPIHPVIVASRIINCSCFVFSFLSVEFPARIILLSIFMSEIQGTKLSWMQVCITKNWFCKIFCTLIFGNMHGIKQQNIHPWTLFHLLITNAEPKTLVIPPTSSGSKESGVFESAHVSTCQL